MTSFLVDQQLPMALATYLAERGHDARHIKEYAGNITTRDLLALFGEHWSALEAALPTYRYLEINRAGVFAHDRG